MDGIGVDLFATKGLEYMLVIGYLFMLVACRRMVGLRPGEASTEESEGGSTESPPFALRKGYHYHRGHAWVCSAGDDRVRVGVDDFAQKLLGPTTGMVLPQVGSHLALGEPGWKIRAGGRSFTVLSPLDGEVVAWNDQLDPTPGLVNSDPYDEGWILELKVRSQASVERNLLSGFLAQAWMDEVRRTVVALSVDRSGVSALEPPSPEIGLAQTLSPDHWEDLVQGFLLTREGVGGSLYDARTRNRELSDQRPQLA